MSSRLLREGDETATLLVLSLLFFVGEVLQDTATAPPKNGEDEFMPGDGVLLLEQLRSWSRISMCTSYGTSQHTLLNSVGR